MKLFRKIVAILGPGIALSLSLAACGTNDGFLPPGLTLGPAPDTTPPSIVSTVPGTDAADVFINTAITANFSEYIDYSTLSAATFTIRDASNNPVSGNVTGSGWSITFTPGAYLSPMETYTATITTGIADPSGNHLLQDHTWSFTTSSKTDFTAPAVVSTSPLRDVWGAAIASSVTVTFNEAMNPVTINAGTFYLKDASQAVVPGVISCNGTSATLTPSNLLNIRSDYTACVTTGVTDLAGNQLQYERCWDFTTTANSALFEPAIAIQTGSWPVATAIGDVNDDGQNDVVLVTDFYFDPNHDYRLFVFLNDGSGNLTTTVTYTTASASTYPSTIAVGDVNHDGKNEVVVGNKGANIEVFTQDGMDGLVSSAVYTTVNSDKIRLADLNKDGLLDIVGVGWATNSIDIFLQNADGTLSAATYTVTNGGYEDLAIGDVNNDGLPDIIVMSGQTWLPNIGVLIQKPGGTFNSPVYYSVGYHVLTSGIAVGDVNGDGLDDVVVLNGPAQTREIGIFIQNSAGTLDPVVTYPAYGWPGPLEVIDVTGDGRKDILVAHESAVGLYVQGEDGTLRPEEMYGLPYSSYDGFAVGDINGDGLNDVAIPAFGYLEVLYHK